MNLAVIASPTVILTELGLAPGTPALQLL
jgi:hypothetical protein